MSALRKINPQYANRDPEFEKLCNVLRSRGDLQRIADDAKVHVSTLYNWVELKTFSPRIHTMVKVAKAVGFHFRLVRGRK